MKKKIIIASIILGAILLAAGVYVCREKQEKKKGMYVVPEAQAVRGKLDEWADNKFGVLIHWGLYSEIGIVESWTICAEEQDWIPRDSTANYEEYKQWYWNTADRFNPEDFDPDQWAELCKQTGFKYLVFTSKHHDGFNMYDTKFSDFSISKHAFKDNPRNNVVAEVFDAFRKKDFMIGLYYSKPDWHSDYYWWRRYSTPTRGANYKIADNNWRWLKFEEFIFNQLNELTDGSYGDIDILWLDGGWVVGASERDIERRKAGEPFRRPGLDMDKLASIVRGNQDGLLIVDRSIAGKYQDYLTPEREKNLPEKQITDYPWEINVPLAQDWGYNPDNIQKSVAEVIHYLAEVVAKGGNMILGFGPDGKGRIPDDVQDRLAGIGQWLDRNGEAIYATRPTKLYADQASNTWFTQSKSGDVIYAVTCLKDGEAIPEKIVIESCTAPVSGAEIKCLSTGTVVEWEAKGDGIEIVVPAGLPADYPAVAFSYRIK